MSKIGNAVIEDMENNPWKYPTIDDREPDFPEAQ
jgi:hypothetical protein